jgi:glutamine amidotransferase
MLAIIDYKAGNQTSVQNALAHLGIESEITSSPLRLEKARGIIFPGVGAAGQAMAVLGQSGLEATIKRLVDLGRPFLGICLGCQIMLEESQENQAKTLGILPGRTLRFPKGLSDESGAEAKVPHMGWNRVTLLKPSPLWQGIGPEDQFYFVHSYYPSPEPSLSLGQTSHGLAFSSFFGRDGLWAVQFHPEKSGPPGLRLLENFYRYCLERPEA